MAPPTSWIVSSKNGWKTSPKLLEWLAFSTLAGFDMKRTRTMGLRPLQTSNGGCMAVRSLWHFQASAALQGGQNPVVVSNRLGHASLSITLDVYAHTLPGCLSAIQAGRRRRREAFDRAMEWEGWE